MSARRLYARWAAREDRALLAYEPGHGLTLRDLAARLGRSYYACRIRRKVLRGGRIDVERPRATCGRCDRRLPAGQTRGLCRPCRRQVSHERSVEAHRLSLEATGPTAVRRWELWTAEEDAAVLARIPDVELARRLQRTLGACLQRRYNLRCGRVTPGGQQGPRGGNHGRPLPDRCRAGHLFDEANTYVDPKGRRHCRACGSARARQYLQRRREQRAAA